MIPAQPDNQGILGWLWNGGSAVVAGLGMLFGAAIGIGTQRGTIHAHEQRLNSLDAELNRFQDNVQFETRALRMTVEENHRQVMDALLDLKRGS